jgi:CRP-like cAMP-binding protein
VKQRTVKKDGSDIISIFMRRFNLQLNNPDDTIIKQGDLTTDLYFMVQGEASVSLENTLREPYTHFKELSTGDHFGEISALYGCARTATVSALDYCTLAVLSKDNFNKIAGEMPEVRHEMLKCVLDKYSTDDVKMWAFESLLQLPFMQGIERDKEWSLFHRMYFSMTRKVIYQGEFLNKPGDQIKHLTLVQDGVLDVYVI